MEGLEEGEILVWQIVEELDKTGKTNKEDVGGDKGSIEEGAVDLCIWVDETVGIVVEIIGEELGGCKASMKSSGYGTLVSLKCTSLELYIFPHL